MINRHNNKYSYTGASDDNLLKNIELFDKLSLRFSNRVLFIKDVIGSNEICCWSFYGHGKKIAEVCCTAIVYAWNAKPAYKIDRRSNAFATSVHRYTLEDMDLDDSESEGFRDAVDENIEDPAKEV